MEYHSFLSFKKFVASKEVKFVFPSPYGVSFILIRKHKGLEVTQ